MQEMLDIVLDYAGDHRFQIHPVKSNAPIWKLERVAITFFFRFSVSRPYSNLGIT
jgi:hypothetical protein